MAREPNSEMKENAEKEERTLKGKMVRSSKKYIKEIGEKTGDKRQRNQFRNWRETSRNIETNDLEGIL